MWALAAFTQAAPADVQLVQVSAPWRVEDATLADLDGDGRDELLLATSAPAATGTPGGRPRPARRLEVYAWSADARAGFAARLEHSIDLTEDVVAFAVGDLGFDAGDELVLFNSRGAFLADPAAPEAERFRVLLRGDFLWQLADPRGCFQYSEALQDLDGDGFADIVLPEPGGWRLALSSKGFEVTSRPRMPLDAEVEGSIVGAGANAQARGRGAQVSLSFGASGDRFGALVSVSESVPAPQLLDWNADRRIDLLAQGERELFVWLQGPDGGFGVEPTLRLPLPVAAGRERRLDASYSAHTLDLDSDARADAVLFAGDKRSEDVRTQVLVFRQSGKGEGRDEIPLFGTRGVPDQLLVLAGFVAGATFQDVDGDGTQDLFVRAVRPDLIDQLRSAATESIEAEAYLYLDRGGRFSPRPDATLRARIPLQSFDLTLAFLGDIDGDGLSDLLLRDTPERMRVLALRRGRGGAEFDKQPLFQRALSKDAQLRVLERPGRKVASVLALEERQVLVMTFP